VTPRDVRQADGGSTLATIRDAYAFAASGQQTGNLVFRFE
jgi:hypothetical protein